MLDKQLAENFDDVGKLLAGDDQTEGVMKKFNSALLDLTSPTRGLYAAKKDRHDAAVRRLDQQILDTEARLQKREEALRARFSAMELLVSEMNSQSSYLGQQMASLSNMMTGNKE
jgi:flagellar hook-associated protein 2